MSERLLLRTLGFGCVGLLRRAGPAIQYAGWLGHVVCCALHPTPEGSYMPKAKVVNIRDRTLPTQRGNLPESLGKKRAKLEIHENVEHALVAIERDDWEAAKEPPAHAAQLMRALERLPVKARKIRRLEADPGKSQSLERGLIIIEQFATKPVMGIADVADATKQSRSTVHRYMTTLVAMGVLEQVPGRKYRLIQA